MINNIDNLQMQLIQLSDEMKDLKQLLQDFIKDPAEQAKVIGIDDVSILTGYSKHTIYQYVHKELIPYHKPEHVGRKLIFFKSEIENWIEGKKKETSEEFIERKETELFNQYKRVLNKWN